ncbi:MAG: cob(I)yrinic acid a,c-diamide adenosyltransferase [Planctomycetota bacterium]
MVKLNKIYTRTGDKGTTGLVTGERVSKADARVEAYGTVDEANAAIGVAVTLCKAPCDDSPALAAVGKLLESIQHDLFDCGADLATPVAPDEAEGAALRIVAGQIERLEREIDRHNEHLEPLTSFVLPGGTPLSAALHVARTVSRRAERCAVALNEADNDGTNDLAVAYLNRLSDLLFVLCRVANDHGKSDVLWKPGNSRGSEA